MTMLPLHRDKGDFLSFGIFCIDGGPISLPWKQEQLCVPSAKGDKEARTHQVPRFYGDKEAARSSKAKRQM